MVEGKSCQHPGRIGSCKSNQTHMAPEMGVPHHLETLVLVFFVVVLRLSFAPESINLTQFESMQGTAERDNDVWQPVVSLLHAFACQGGNGASLS